MAPLPLLDRVRVLDLTKATSGPFATQVLGDLGAEVIKVEEPAGSALSRVPLGTQRLKGGMDPYFLGVNRNKKSVVLRLASEVGRATFYDLVAHADAVIDNYRPGVAAKLGVDHDTLASINPGIITSSITGYGPNGLLTERTAFDITVQAESGMLAWIDKRTSDGELDYPNLPAADLLAGLYCALGLTGALHRRSVTGIGGRVDVAMFDAMLSWYTGFAVDLLNFGDATLIHAGSLWGTFRTRTRPLTITAHRETPWRRFCAAIDRAGWTTDARFATADARSDNIGELRRLVTEVLGERGADEWIEIFDRAGVSYAEVRTPAEALNSAQAREMVRTVSSPGTGEITLLGNPIKVPGAAQPFTAPPQLGEHTEQVLSDLLGYSAEQVGAVLADATPQPER